MDVARQMARTYQETPYGLVLLAGDISYYGSIDDRWNDVFVVGFPGTPAICRNPGLAQTIRRTSPTGIAIMEESAR